MNIILKTGLCIAAGLAYSVATHKIVEKVVGATIDHFWKDDLEDKDMFEGYEIVRRQEGT